MVPSRQEFVIFKKPRFFFIGQILIAEVSDGAFFCRTELSHFVKRKWLKFWMVSRNLSYTNEFPDCHLIKFWQTLKHFLDFKSKKNFFYTWEHSSTRNQNVNKFFVKISDDLYNFCRWTDLILVHFEEMC